MAAEDVPPDVNRRTLLARTGTTLGVAALGGCLSRAGVPGGNGGGTREPPTLVDESFSITDAGCGQGTSEASVGFDREAGAVVVSGTVPGSNTCYVAELADASFDPDAGTLTVTVRSVEKDDAEACGQCIVDIDYEATVSFEAGLPASVAVVHEAMGESETVASGDRGGT